jgi:hypothetical protein
LTVLVALAVAAAIGSLVVVGVLAGIQWSLEWIFSRRFGFYCGCLEICFVVGLLGFGLYVLDGACDRYVVPGTDRLSPNSCQGGGGLGVLIGYAVVGSLGLIVLPLMVFSTWRLAKWSAKRAVLGSHR